MLVSQDYVIVDLPRRQNVDVILVDSVGGFRVHDVTQRSHPSRADRQGQPFG